MLGVLLLAVFIRMPVFSGWDEAFYMSQMSSAILDRDLMLQNDLLTYPNAVCEKIRLVAVLRPDGVHIHAFSIGPSLFYSMVAIPVYRSGAERFGIDIRRALALWAVFFLVLGLMGLDRVIAEFGFQTNTRYAAILASVFSTPFLHYGSRTVISSHFPATLATMFCILFWMKWLNQPRYEYVWAAGLCSGWLAITRWQACVFLLFLLPPVLIKMLEKTDRMKRLTGLIIGFLSIVLVVSLQMLAWKTHYGKWICKPVHAGFVDLSSPDLLAFTFSGYHGLIPWAPGLLVGWIGLVLIGFRKQNTVHRWLVWGFMAGMLFQYYINACVWDWWGGGSYGPRRMTFLLAPAALGWAFVIRKTRVPVKVMLCAAAIAWGIFTLAAFSESVDDLTLLFTGKPDTWRPAECEVSDDVIETRWDRWTTGFKRFTKLNFVLKEPFRRRHRHMGLLILGLVTALAVWAGGRLGRMRLFQRITLSAVSLYIVWMLATWCAWFPSNEPWHSHWAAVVRDQPAWFPEEEIPDGYRDAVRFMRTFNRLKRNGCGSVPVPDGETYDVFPGISLRELCECVPN